MSVNLIQEVKDLFNQQTIEEAGNKLGESPSAISAALKAMVPAIFGSFIQKASTPEGEAQVAQLTSAEILQADPNQSNISGLMSGSNGNTILTSLFGNTGGINSVIAGFAGIKQNSSSTLLGIAASAVAGFLGRYFQQNNISGHGISEVLNSQKQHVQEALPAGLSMAALMGSNSSATTPVHPAQAAAHTHTHGHAAHGAHAYREDDVPASGGVLKYILPIIFLALIGAAALYFFKSDKHESAGHGTAEEHTTVPHNTEPHTNITDTINTAPMPATVVTDSAALNTQNREDTVGRN